MTDYLFLSFLVKMSIDVIIIRILTVEKEVVKISRLLRMVYNGLILNCVAYSVIEVILKSVDRR